MNINYMVFGGILLVLILLSMSSSCVTPYHANSAFLKEYTYEGMEGEEEAEGMEGEEEAEGMEGEEEAEGMEGEEEAEGMEGEEEAEGMEGEEGMKHEGMKYEGMKHEGMKHEGMKHEGMNHEGFEGLGTSDYNNNAFILDQFSSAVGSPECVGKSSGLSNSTGPLCLSEDQKRLLQTRGGNATGMDSQIGGR